MNQPAESPETAPTKPVRLWPAFIIDKPGRDTHAYDYDYRPTHLAWTFGTMDHKVLCAQVAAVNSYMSALDKWVKAAKEVIRANVAGVDEMQPGDQKELPTLEGALIPVFTCRERTGLDTDKLKQEYGEAWYAEHCKTTKYFEIRFKKPGAAATEE